jgi:hypothetical protein
VFFVGLGIDENSSLPTIPPGLTLTLEADLDIDMREHELYLGYAAIVRKGVSAAR